ncbi:TIGR02679 family protein [Bacillus sp. FJAT-49705]|uniref:TIGR02679 family protein n=1 Tax=Cytobacillus citreus TaxID=2833586 RepID=A0ABS5NWP6_9BACI|nr:TIGR02679 family protein [Cytobacillus citreus]MBS4192250.1 TIGR02679 family protein [Cytobacillus citreus]
MGRGRIKGVIGLNERLQECIQYFKEEPGLSRLLPKLIERYRSLGRIGGSVQLTGLKPYEKEALSAFFRKDYTRQASATISFTLFENALAKTKYFELAIIDILEAYEGREIKTNSEKQLLIENEKSAFFYELKQEVPEIEDWLSFIERKGRGSRLFHSLYEKDCLELKKILLLVAEAIKSLPQNGQFERLPFFSQRITKNPHAFDLDTELGRAFIHSLQFSLHQKGEWSIIKNKLNTEEVNEILQAFHIFRDDLLNFVTVSGIKGWKNDRIDATIEAAADNRTVLILPLREILKLTSARPHIGKRVFIVENSGVCSAILDRWQLPFYPPLISTNGQFKLAALMLLDLFVQEEIEIYYSGDFDPEGLLMAQRMKLRHSKHVTLWRYSPHDYLKSLSTKEIAIDKLAQLNRLHIPDLESVKTELLKTYRAGYQEELIEELVSDMERYYLTL